MNGAAAGPGGGGPGTASTSAASALVPVPSPLPAGPHAAAGGGPPAAGAPVAGSVPGAAGTALLPVLPGGVDPKAPPVEDVIVTTRTSYHVLRFVETTFDSSVFLHLWLDRSTGNLAMARLRLRELAERLVLV
ncbi:hypothetical protein [Streptomyces sp. NPDC015131]|uniref:hypothetical protein n=1 Tax=Streptomyces sp. NPDC015131 TaxID=3364941 RepID=UPI0036FDAC36